MSIFEVAPNVNNPFLRKLKIRLKSVSFANALDLPKTINLDTKWEIEKKLMTEIASSKRLRCKNTKLTEIRFILQRIASQVSTESEISRRTSEVLMGILIDRISSSLSQAQRKEQLIEHQEQELYYSGTFLNMDEFSCQSCSELLYNPVTLSCGHSFCQCCLTRGCMEACIVCNKALKKDYRINMLLSAVLQKWHSTEWTGRSLVAEGLKKFIDAEYKDAVMKFSQALDIIPNSHIATLHRAKAYYLLKQLDRALEDSIRASLLAHKWPEAYYVKGEILFKLHCYEESLLSLLICLVLDPKNTSVKNRIHEIITKLVSSANTDMGNRPKPSQSDLPSSSSSANCPMPQKRPSSESEKNRLTSCKAFKKEADEHITENATIRTSIVLCPSGTKSDSDQKLEASEERPDSMSSCNTRVLLTFELSYDKGRNEIPFGEGLGMFPSIASELENALDSVLFEIDNSVTRDLHMLQTSTLDKKLMELVNIELPRKPRVVDPKLINVSEFECSLCMRLFQDPVCTPCGHVFCQLCIERCLDHSPQCPLCKHPMRDYLAESLEKGHPTCDYATKSIIQQHLPEPCKERSKQYKEEMTELLEREPIFVCTIAFPSVPCPLHVFEPRYRLMLRRCLDHNEREFGMCMPGKENSHHEIGTLLKVRDVKFFPDGRSVVDCVGFRRFKTSNCQMQDGYNVAKITYIVDKPITNLQTHGKLIDKVYAEARVWFDELEASVKDRIMNYFGTFPVKDGKVNAENGPDWVWWVLAILPVEDRVKAGILGKNSIDERLLILLRIFACLRQRRTQLQPVQW